MGFDQIDKNFKRETPVAGPTWFTLKDDTECVGEDVAELLQNYGADQGEPVEISECVVKRTLWGVRMPLVDDCSEDEYRQFASKDEALAWTKERDAEIEEYDRKQEEEESE